MHWLAGQGTARPRHSRRAAIKARWIAYQSTDVFEGLANSQLPTLHEIRALSSHLYVKAGYDVSAVQHLIAHTDPDMTRAYQKGHARKVLRVDMMLPFSLDDDDRSVREQPPEYGVLAQKCRQEIFSENFLTRILLTA